MRKMLCAAISFILLATACAAGFPGNDPIEKGVRFTFSDPSAMNVAIAGSFNHWDPGKDVLKGPDNNGIWVITLPLPAGRYEYSFVVNGTRWVLDPTAPSTDDGMGGRNSVVIAPR